MCSQNALPYTKLHKLLGYKTLGHEMPITRETVIKKLDIWRNPLEEKEVGFIQLPMQSCLNCQYGLPNGHALVF